MIAKIDIQKLWLVVLFPQIVHHLFAVRARQIAISDVRIAHNLFGGGVDNGASKVANNSAFFWNSASFGENGFRQSLASVSVETIAASILPLQRKKSLSRKK